MKLKSQERLIHLVILSILTLGVFIPPIWGSSEAREAHVVQTIIRDNSWVLPDRNGIVPSKPPLLHWTAAVVAEVTTLSPLYSIRIVSLFSFIALFWAWLDVLKGINTRSAASADLERWFMITFFSSYGIVSMATDARVDTLFAALVGVSVRAIFTLDQNKYSQSMIGLFCGFSVLAKGPLGFALVYSAFLIRGFLLLRSGTLTLQLMRIVRSAIFPAIISILVALPWYIAAYDSGGAAFFNRQVSFENVARFVGGEGVNSQPVYFYLVPLLLGIFPWSLLLPSLVRDSINSFFSDLPKERMRAFGLIWGVLIVVLFSLASGKRAAYLLPILPAFLVSISFFINRRGFFKLERSQIYLLSRSFAWICFVILIVTALCLELLLIPGGAELVGLPSLTETGAYNLRIMQLILTLIAALTFTLIKQTSVVLVSAPIILYFGALFSCLTTSRLLKGEFKGFDINAEFINSKIPHDAPILVVKDLRDEYLDPVLYLINRRASVLSSINIELQREKGPFYLIIRKQLLPDYNHGSVVMIKELLERHSEEKERVNNFVLYRVS